MSSILFFLCPGSQICPSTYCKAKYSQGESREQNVGVVGTLGGDLWGETVREAALFFFFFSGGIGGFVPPEGSASRQKAAGQKRQRIMGNPLSWYWRYAHGR